MEKDAITISHFGNNILWKDVIEAAQRRPAMYIGEPLTAHFRAVEGALQFVWTAKPFKKPFKAHIVASPSQYIVLCRTGPLHSDIEQSTSWMSGRMLIDLLNAPSFNRTSGATLRSGTQATVLAKQSFVGIKSNKQFYYQEYSGGWPVAGVDVLQQKTLCTFVVAGSLTSEWFPGLPFSVEGVSAAIPPKAKPYVSVEWQSSDILLEDHLLERIVATFKVEAAL